MDRETGSHSFFDEWKAPLVLLAACLFLFFFRLGHFGLLEGGESYYPAAVREMVEAHEWIIPHLNYQIYFSKPILTFWLIGSAYKAFGISELSGRLWSAFLSMALVSVCYCTARKVSNTRAAFIAALILASSPLLLGTCRRSSIDVYFSFFLDAGICATVLVLFANRARLWPLIYLSLALAVLTKGPAALVLFGLGVLFYAAVRRPSLSELSGYSKLLHPWYGVSLFAAVVLPWFAAIGYATNWLFLKVFLIYENLSRFAGHTNSKTPHFWWYLWTLLYGLFPWSLFLPAALVSLFRRPKTDGSSSSSGPSGSSGSSPGDALLFLGCCAIAMLLFFSFSRTQFETYVLPAWCPLVIVLGATVDRLIRNATTSGADDWERFRKYGSPLIALIAVLGSIVLALLPSALPILPVWMRIFIAIAVMALSIGWIGQFFLLQKSRILAATLLLAAGTACGYGALSPVLTELWYQSSFKDVQSLAASLSASDDEVSQYKDFMPSLLFYRKGSVDFFYHPEDLIPKYKAEPKEIEHAKNRLYVIVRQCFADELAANSELHLQLVEQRGDWRLYKTDSAILRTAPTLEFTFKRLSTMDVLTDKYHWGPLTMPYSGGDFKRPTVP